MEVWWGLGYHTIFFLAGLAAIPKDLPEAARIDGANEWQVFWHVTRPRLAPIMMILVVLRFGTAMAVIDEYLIFGGFNRDSPTYTWTIFMYDQAFKLGLWRQGFAAAIGMIGAVAMMIVMIFLLRIFRSEGLSAMTRRRARSHRRRRAPSAATARHRAGLVPARTAAPSSVTRVINFFMVIILAPLAWVFMMSIKSRPDAMRGDFWPRKFDFTHYGYVFEKIDTLPINLFNSIYVTTGTVLLTTICAVLAGYALVHMQAEGRRHHCRGAAGVALLPGARRLDHQRLRDPGLSRTSSTARAASSCPMSRSTWRSAC